MTPLSAFPDKSRGISFSNRFPQWLKYCIFNTVLEMRKKKKKWSSFWKISSFRGNSWFYFELTLFLLTCLYLVPAVLFWFGNLLCRGLVKGTSVLSQPLLWSLEFEVLGRWPPGLLTPSPSCLWIGDMLNSVLRLMEHPMAALSLRTCAPQACVGVGLDKPNISYRRKELSCGRLWVQILAPLLSRIVEATSSTQLAHV